MVEDLAFVSVREADLEPKNRLAGTNRRRSLEKSRSTVPAEFGHRVRRDGEEIRRGDILTGTMHGYPPAQQDQN